LHGINTCAIAGKRTNLPVFHFISDLYFAGLSLNDDYFSAVSITFYMLLAAGNSGFGALSSYLAVFIAVPDSRHCSRWRFCASKSNDHATRQGGTAVISECCMHLFLRRFCHRKRVLPLHRNV
jgi:hypothetical protein